MCVMLKGETPLMSAISSYNDEFVVMLLEQPNIDFDGALLSAIGSGNLYILNMLLEAGADPNTEYADQTPLIFSAGTTNESFIEALLEHGADINKQWSNGL
jgi:ankyrin repeat protein